MDNFTSIGTDKLSIGKRLKMGSSTLDTLPFKQYGVLDETQTTVVLIRDVLDKWKSGYKQELEEKFEHGTNLFNFIERPENLNPNALRRFWQRFKYGYYTTFTNPDEVTLVGLEILSKLQRLNLELQNLEDEEKRIKTDKDRLQKSQGTLTDDIEREKNIILEATSNEKRLKEEKN